MKLTSTTQLRPHQVVRDRIVADGALAGSDVSCSQKSRIGLWTGKKKKLTCSRHANLSSTLKRHSEVSLQKSITS